MGEQTTVSQIDSILQPLLLLRPDQQTEWEQSITDIISKHAAATIRKVIGHKLNAYIPGEGGTSEHQDTEDIYSEVVVRLLTRLREFRTSPDQNAIRDFQGYVAVTSYHACYEFLRRKYPQRSQLKNKLRYLLSHQPGLAIWQTEGAEWICGLEAWRGRRAPLTRSHELHRLRDNPELLVDAELRIDAAPTATLVKAIFNFTGKPVELDDLVGLVGGICGIKDAPARSDVLLQPVTEAPPLPGKDQLIQLKGVWDEIIQLPLRQRIALLLNLRDDSGGVIEYLPVAGIASLRQIAEILEMSAEELARIWNSLPLDDERIAQYLGATRQQVINLRKCARERLLRRMKAVDQGRRNSASSNMSDTSTS